MDQAALTGKLTLTASGWAVVRVPHAILKGFFDALHEPGIIPSPHLAHISVMTPEEILKAGGPDKLTERGRDYSFFLKGVKHLKPAGWEGVERCWILECRSPELEALRKSYGLTPLLHGDHEFHITVAIRRSGVLQENRKMKYESPAKQLASKVHFNTLYKQLLKQEKHASTDLMDFLKEAGELGAGDPLARKAHGVVKKFAEPPHVAAHKAVASWAMKQNNKPRAPAAPTLGQASTSTPVKTAANYAPLLAGGAAGGLIDVIRSFRNTGKPRSMANRFAGTMTGLGIGGAVTGGGALSDRLAQPAGAASQASATPPPPLPAPKPITEMMPAAVEAPGPRRVTDMVNSVPGWAEDLQAHRLDPGQPMSREMALPYAVRMQRDTQPLPQPTRRGWGSNWFDVSAPRLQQETRDQNNPADRRNPVSKQQAMNKLWTTRGADFIADGAKALQQTLGNNVEDTGPLDSAGLGMIGSPGLMAAGFGVDGIKAVKRARDQVQGDPVNATLMHVQRQAQQGDWSMPQRIASNMMNWQGMVRDTMLGGVAHPGGVENQLINDKSVSDQRHMYQDVAAHIARAQAGEDPGELWKWMRDKPEAYAQVLERIQQEQGAGR